MLAMETGPKGSQVLDGVKVCLTHFSQEIKGNSDLNSATSFEYLELASPGDSQHLTHRGKYSLKGKRDLNFFCVS